MTEEQIRQVKLDKIERLREQGINPYPERFERTHSLRDAAELAEGTTGVRICGRIVSRREFGKLSFFDLQDMQGRCQASIQQDEVGKDVFKRFIKLVDIGDFVGVEGEMYKTRVGQTTVKATEFQLLGKTLHPLPEKYHAINDQELRYRRRYLDLITDEESRSRFLLRSKLIRVMRDYLDSQGFDEVETPVLQTKPSGALATPFMTHHNALDLPLYLRIAPETYLKRCIVAGFDRVYEFSRVFRNEGMDPSHLQDFTMLEYYSAYWNYIDNMNFTETLIRDTLEKCLDTLEVEVGGEKVDFAQDWPRRGLTELIDEHAGIDVGKYAEAGALREAITDKKIHLDGIEKFGRGALIDQLYKKVCRPKLTQPVFVTSHPIDLSPLARRNDDQPEISDRFQLVVRGWELLNAYSELVDPIDQRQRLEEQAQLNAGGDDEAMVMDEDYLLAMEHGMPPISGWGMGIDRFVALVTGAENLRDVVLFPLLKPEDFG
ncbi:MAG: lysine--tRNA ligase [Planctomycetota bacterium]